MMRRVSNQEFGRVLVAFIKLAGGRDVKVACLRMVRE